MRTDDETNIQPNYRIKQHKGQSFSLRICQHMDYYPILPSLP